MNRLMVIVAVATLAGCAVSYHKPGSDLSASEKDRRECAYDAERATAGIANLGVQIGERANLMQSCMASRGYVSRVN